MWAAKARTHEELEKVLAAALELITEADCLAWFMHCGLPDLIQWRIAIGASYMHKSLTGSFCTST